jgi:hypothetical protein
MGTVDRCRSGPAAVLHGRALNLVSHFQNGLPTDFGPIAWHALQPINFQLQLLPEVPRCRGREISYNPPSDSQGWQRR